MDIVNNSKELNDEYLIKGITSLSSVDYSAATGLLPVCEVILNKPTDPTFYELCLVNMVAKTLTPCGGHLLPLKFLSFSKKFVKHYKFTPESDESLFFYLSYWGLMIDLKFFDDVYKEVCELPSDVLERALKSEFFDLLYKVVKLRSTQSSKQRYDTYIIYCQELSQIIQSSSGQKLHARDAYFLTFLMDIAYHNDYPCVFISEVDYILHKLDQMNGANYLYSVATFLTRNHSIDKKDEIVRYLQKSKINFSDDYLILNYGINYRLNHLAPEKMTLGERIFTIFFSPVALIFENFEKTDYDSVHRIEDNKIQKLEDFYGFHNINGDYLDLVAGIYKKGEEKILLSEYRCRALFWILTFGDIGIRDLILAEKIFTNEDMNLSSYAARTQDIVTKLKLIGMPIKRHKGRIRFSFTDHTCPIFLTAKFNVTMGRINLINKKHHRINRSLVQEELSLSRASANRYLKEWVEGGFLKNSPSAYGDYLPTF